MVLKDALETGVATRGISDSAGAAGFSRALTFTDKAKHYGAKGLLWIKA